MQIKQILTFTANFYTALLFAAPPVEVISSCTHDHAVRPTVTMTQLEAPRLIEIPEAGCEDHYENSIDSLIYGGIFCNNYGYIILNNQRIKLSDAVSFSVNPAIKPGIQGSRIALWSVWSKIDFSNDTYLCIASGLSTSGDGAAASQYYIVEHPYDPTSALNYYFFEKDIMPISSYTD